MVNIRTFKPSLRPEDIKYKFLEEIVDSEGFLEDSLQNLERQLYLGRELNARDIIKRPDWKEIVVEEIGSSYNGQELNQILAPMTSYEAQARQQFLVSKRPLIGDVVLVSADDEIILGVRGGSGAINSFPTYYTTYRRDRQLNPLTDSLYAELMEEGDLRKDDIDSAELIGCFYDGKYTKGQNYVWLVKSNNSTDEIIEKQKNSRDSYEYDMLFPVKTDVDSIIDLIRADRQMFPLAMGTLSVYTGIDLGRT